MMRQWVDEDMYKRTITKNPSVKVKNGKHALGSDGRRQINDGFSHFTALKRIQARVDAGEEFILSPALCKDLEEGVVTTELEFLDDDEDLIFAYKKNLCTWLLWAHCSALRNCAQQLSRTTALRR